MLLLTGATGKTGRAVLQALAPHARPVRALTRAAAQVPVLRALGAHEVGDLHDIATVRHVLQGVQAVYHLCPNVSPAEVALGQQMIAAAQAAGVEHFVYHSVLHPQAEAMPHHWRKLRVEEALFTSRLPFTILQPTAYMQNLLANLTANGLRVPYAAATRLSLVDLADVAAVAARVLTEPGHLGATYELVGTPPLSQTEVAATLSAVLGRPVSVETQPMADWAAQARAHGLREDAIQTLLQMFDYYERYGMGGNPQVLHWLLQRAPTTLESFWRRQVGIAG